jgi:DNA-binding transcriptional LysR family regulator
MDRFEAMKVFVRVVELQSFTQAAASLDLPKASVSTAVQNLEALVNARLLHRTTRQVGLTPDGSSFYERCKDLLADLDETESMFRTEPTQIKGVIRVDATVTLARRLIVPRLPEFLAEHPGIEIELSSTDRRVDPIREGIDCVIRGGTAVEPGMVERPLGHLTIVNCASPEYLAAYGTPQTLEDLKTHKLIRYVQQLGTTPGGFEVADGGKVREVKMSGRLVVNNTDTYEAACLAGLGIAQDPLVGIQQYLRSGDLVEVLPAFRAEPLPMKLVYPQRRLLAKRVRAFIDWLEPVLKAYIQ